MASSMRDIKAMLSATKKTSQITNAMNMVSASKLRLAQKNALSFYKYMQRVIDIISSLSSQGSKLNHPLLKEREVKRTCYVMISSDRGLAGSFNANINKLVMNNLGKDDYVIPFGMKAYYNAKSKHLKSYLDESISLPDDVGFDSILDLITKCVKGFLKGDFDSLVLVYNHFVNTLKIVPTLPQVLPIAPDFEADEEKKKAMAIYEFDDSVESMLDTILPLYLENVVYGVILDSKASEHASRMSAMKNATDNAEKLIEKLELRYNIARQAAITSELTDIVSGSKAINGGN